MAYITHATPVMRFFTFIKELLDLNQVIPYMMTKGNLKSTEVCFPIESFAIFVESIIFIMFQYLKFSYQNNTEFVLMLDRKGKNSQLDIFKAFPPSCSPSNDF
jgi:hypothetical protein